MKRFNFLFTIVAIFFAGSATQAQTTADLKVRLDQTLVLVMNLQQQVDSLQAAMPDSTGLDSTARANLMTEFLKAGHKEYVSMPGKAAYADGRPIIIEQAKAAIMDLNTIYSELDSLMAVVKARSADNAGRLNDVEAVAYDDDFDVQNGTEQREVNRKEDRKAAKERIKERIRNRALLDW